jgi:hypothetical protein
LEIRKLYDGCRKKPKAIRTARSAFKKVCKGNFFEPCFSLFEESLKFLINKNHNIFITAIHTMGNEGSGKSSFE